jgi:hypothetical protein
MLAVIAATLSELAKASLGHTITTVLARLGGQMGKHLRDDDAMARPAICLPVRGLKCLGPRHRCRVGG